MTKALKDKPSKHVWKGVSQSSDQSPPSRPLFREVDLSADKFYLRKCCFLEYHHPWDHFYSANLHSWNSWLHRAGEKRKGKRDFKACCERWILAVTPTAPQVYHTLKGQCVTCHCQTREGIWELRSLWFKVALWVDETGQALVDCDYKVCK